MRPCAQDVAGLYATEGRRAVISVVTEQILSAASEGPRATEQFAATAAAFIAACAGALLARHVCTMCYTLVAEELQSACNWHTSRKTGGSLALMRGHLLVVLSD
eukprot:359258-Chlamydomonas_euryale.AAC.5